MLDKSIPHFLVALEKKDAKNYPRYEFPEGYTVHMYQPDMGYVEAYARMEVESGQYEAADVAMEKFAREFLRDPELDPRERCVFLKAPDGEIVATCSMWKGCNLSAERRPRLHWLIVDSSHEGKGIARAMVTKVLDLNAELDGGDYVYLNTATWNYRAINLYLSFGFTPYRGPKPPISYKKLTEEEYQAKNAEAWEIIMDKINSYKARKKS